jgi:hypothetical protein
MTDKERIEERANEVQVEMEHRLAMYLRQVRAEFCNRFPKRRVGFIDAMGVIGWTVSGFEDPYYKTLVTFGMADFDQLDPRIRKLFAPLEEAYEFYLEMADRFNLTVEIESGDYCHYCKADVVLNGGYDTSYDGYQRCPVCQGC